MNLAAILIIGLDAAAGPETLADTARIFEYDLNTRFTLDGQVLCKLKIPTEARPELAYNMPDNAYMTGIHLGTLAMKYAVTGDDDTRREAERTIRALDLLCTVSGKPGLLARAAWPADRPHHDDGHWRTGPGGLHVWRGDVSSDQVDGVVYGFSLAYDLVAGDEGKRLIAKNIAAIVDHVLQNDLRIVGYDGQPTTWGRYNPEYVTQRESMNALLFLQHLKVAAHVTGEQRFKDAYREFAIDKGYAEIATRARRLRAPDAVNHSDDVLIYLAIFPLLRLETEPTLRETYLKTLRRTWFGNDTYPGVEPEHNPFFNFVTALYLDGVKASSRSLDNLRHFPFSIKWNSGTITEYSERFRFDSAEFGSRRIDSGAAGAVPVWDRVKNWSVWVQNPYTSRGSRAQDIGMEYNGHDFLMAYWFGRYLGYIGPDD